MLRRTLLAASFFSALSLAGTAVAEPAKVTIPAGAGGGYDTTTRLTFRLMESQGLWRDGAVFSNRPGAGGTLGLGEFIRNNRGQNNAVLGMGVILLGSIVVTQGSPQISETTPLARLTFEYNGIAVPANSPVRSVADLMNALKANPGAVPFGGGSAGGVDHIIAGLMAKAADVGASRVNYIPFASGAEAVTQLAGGRLAAVIQGASELKGLADAGRVRLIAVTSPERIPGIDVPTLKESGVDVAMGNWRGIVGAPGMSAAAQAAWVERLEKLTGSPEWRAELAKFGLESAFLGGAAFGQFMAEENARIRPILTDMGLAK